MSKPDPTYSTAKEVVTAFRAAGHILTQIPGRSTWRMRCPKCRKPSALSIIATEDTARPVTLYCVKCKFLTFAEIPTEPAAPPDRTPPPSAPRRYEVVRADKITPEAVDWFWPGYLAYGTLAVLDGNAGVGKSTLLYHLIARATRGQSMPDQT